MTKKIILDCDPGHDDAIAIILAASKISDLKIETITTVSGNIGVENTTANALKVCDIIGLHDVPVAKGAERPLVKEKEAATEIHGETGLDGPELPEKPSREAVDQHGVDLIIEKLLDSEGDISLVPTGPLTNIALAMIKEPKIISKIKEIVLMGGGTFGNWTPLAEFNIYVDAEAAKVVFESGVPIKMFGLDITHQALATDEIIEELSDIENSVARFVVELLEFFSNTYKKSFGFSGGPIHDACTVAYLIEPSIFHLQPVNVTIETKGEFTYGATVIDINERTGKKVNVDFALSLDQGKFWHLIREALKSYSDE